MKNNLENSIKESLENFEAPYNPNAWKAMSTELDKVMPTSSLGTNVKWVVAASVIIIASVSTYFLLKDDGNRQEETVQVADNTEDVNINNVESNNTNTNSTAESNNANNAFTEITKDTEGNSEPSEIVNESTNNPANGNSNDEEISILEANESNKELEDLNSNEVVEANVKMPNVSSVCSGETVQFENTNSIDLDISGPNYRETIKANSIFSAQLKNVGTYTIQNVLNNATSVFSINSLPKVDFIVDHENKFKDGLPTTKLTSTAGENLTWVVNNVTYEGNEIDIHMYNRGVQNITLTALGTNGCENSVNKQIFNEEKYNLMAVNSFIPNDNDPRLNTFMPFALTQRNTNFTLIIIDPTDGHTVYQTNDSSRGWDGTDVRTGQQVKYESTYIWKVFISNPERGENNEYAGNIIPITK